MHDGQGRVAGKEEGGGVKRGDPPFLLSTGGSFHWGSVERFHFCTTFQTPTTIWNLIISFSTQTSPFFQPEMIQMIKSLSFQSVWGLSLLTIIIFFLHNLKPHTSPTTFCLKMGLMQTQKKWAFTCHYIYLYIKKYYCMHMDIAATPQSYCVSV